ncbi:MULTISPECIES: ABC transporter permease subunit [unclassified Brenneria]|uniref:ABC transporter permease subunit n=1 Tax=unclassified Brenneria TaxID=2634434 RepID=UPI001554579C|nr:MULTISPECIES: ABC transporter permease subunit [unclassified Brenneria]MBJ7221200.1 ABC transporter permease subunit [Brenneria sp. L3-3C-1]MEE3642443.1 ABC transporter permease subunit [Brenneria sp. L3_3C_1]MEE3650193.1 ABC transporter permease subunit [Brenneria sp. HEZEL_4_2_4]NPD00151.1 ABC transporter permease subunit [Brenneria sp. hezel4-2-4]
MSLSLLPPQTTADRWLSRLCLWLPLAALVAFFGVPMLSIVWHSLLDDRTGAFGLSNYLALLDSPGIWRATLNSLILGVVTTLLTLLLGFIVAYGLEFTAMPAKRFISFATSLPVLAPSLVLGLGLIFLLGRNGIVGNMLGVRLDIYGFWGLLIANVLYALPQAILIIRVTLRHSDARQYEAANVLGATDWRQFLDITLPGVRYGLLSAAFVVFTITITDFGNAIVIGGNFSVLATEIYSQVSGQMKFGMGAVVGILLLLPAAASIWIERAASRRQSMIGTHSAMRHVPQALPARDIPFYLATMTIALSIVTVIVTVIIASMIRLWPYRLDLTLRHYDIDLAGGYAPLWTSIWISALAAIIGTTLLFLLTFGIRRSPGKGATIAALLSALPVGVPGLVLGLSYVFTFNSATLPWGMLYGSAILLALCNYYHYHTQGYTTMMMGMRNVPSAMEDATTVLGGGIARILRDVYLPAMRITLISVAMFLFMRSMVTLSAVIFLVTPSLPLGAVTVMRLDEAGFTSQAAAFSTCIMGIVAIMALLLHTLTGKRE